MNKNYYFAFGSNMSTEQLKKRDMNILEAIPASINNYELAFNKKAHNVSGKTFANIVPKINSVVEGILYLTDEKSIENLDSYEAHPRHYIRKEMDIITKSGLTIKAWVYIANPKQIGEGKPDKNYLNKLLAGKDFLSEAYYQKLSLFSTID